MQLGPDQVQAYVANGGRGCPFCAHWDVTGGFVEVNAGTAVQEVSCSQCGATWTDHYRLVDVVASERAILSHRAPDR